MPILNRFALTLALVAALVGFANSQTAFNTDQSILFLAHRETTYEAYSMNPDSSSQRRLTFGQPIDSNVVPVPVHVTSAKWSYDGRKIVSGVTRANVKNSTPDVYVRIANADGSVPVILASGQRPSFRPDGQKIIFERCVGDRCSLYTINPDGTGLIGISIGPADSDEKTASYSPDGSKIIYLCYNSQSSPSTASICTANPDGSGATTLALGLPQGRYPNHPLFSPSGGKILFSARSTTSLSGEIYTANSDGSGLFNVTNDPGSADSNGVWMPDGSSIVYSRSEGAEGVSRLYKVNSDGTGRVQLSSFNAVSADVLRVSRVPVRTPFDFDGDSRADMTVFRPSNNQWYIRNNVTGFSTITWGIQGDKLAAADYDGDWKTDIAVWRPANGTWYIFNSASQTFEVTGWGANGDTALPGDHDGDGKADLAIFRPSEGRWYIRKTASAAVYDGTYTTFEWGVAGDTPMMGDFDGDRRTDAVVFRPSNNILYVRESYQKRFVFETFGEVSDVRVPADYDDDGKTDLAVWRPSTGQWFIKFSSDGAIRVRGWGVAGDKPVPADYDGDGQTDMAVFRPSNSTWYILSLDGSMTRIAFGAAGDVPVQNAYVE